MNYVIFKKGKDLRFIYAYKNLIPTLSPIKSSIIRGLLEILFLPHKMYISIVAIIKTIYRMNVTKMHLLEWLTAEEAEKQAKGDLFSYYKFMLVNLVFGVLLLAIGIITNQMVSIILGTIWLFAPYVVWIISKNYKKETVDEQISKGDKEYLLQIGERTWKFFHENINEENNFLPPDNYQEERKNKITARTSPTNIGLGMLTIISAYDLNYIAIEEALELLNKMIETIDKLSKWNGHLYNWYNTNTLEPLIPRYISTVDNGNFIGYLYTVKQFLIDTLQKGVRAGLDQPEININLGRSRPTPTNR